MSSSSLVLPLILVSCLSVASCKAVEISDRKTVQQEHYSIEVPASWKMQKDASNSSCRVFIDPLVEHPADFAMRVCVLVVRQISLRVKEVFFLRTGNGYMRVRWTVVPLSSQSVET